MTDYRYKDLPRRCEVANGAETTIRELRLMIAYEEQNPYHCPCCAPAQRERLEKLRRRMAEELAKPGNGTQKAFICTVQIVLDGEMIKDKADACDAVSAILADGDGTVIDWGYLSIGGQRLSPQELVLPPDYEEGDFMKGGGF